MLLQQGTKVICSGLGETTPLEYRAVVCGISGRFGDESFKGHTFYILEMIDKLPNQGEYTHVVLSDACIRVVDGN